MSAAICYFPPPSPLSHGMQLTDATRTYILYKVYIKLQQLVKLSVANEKSFSSLFPFLFQLSTARCICSPFPFLPLSLLPAVVTEAARKVELVNSNRIESNRLFLSFFSGSAQLARFVLWLFIAFSAALGQTKVLARRG